MRSRRRSDRPLRRALVWVLIALIAFALVGGVVLPFLIPPPAPPPLTPAPAERTLRIVVSLPVGGAERARTEGVANAVRLALELRGGRVLVGDAVFGVEMQLRDSADAQGAWREELEREHAEAAAADPAVVAYIGPGTLAGASVVAPIARAASLVVIAPTLTAPALSLRGFDDATYEATHPDGEVAIVRVIPSDAVQAAAMARVARDEGLGPVTTAGDGSPYALTMAAAFARAADGLGLERVAEGEAGARFTYLTGTSPEALGRLAAELVARHGELRVGGPEVLLADPFLEAAGREVEGALATFVARPPERPGEGGSAFARAYRDRFARDPDPYAVFGYEAALLALEGIARGGGDRAAVRQAVLATRALEGALGTWGVDANGDTTFAAFQLYVARAMLNEELGWAWDREVTP